MTALDFTLNRNSAGRWCLSVDGRPGEPVQAVRSFPLSAPDEAIGLVGDDGHERLHISHLNTLNAAQREAVQAALAERDFCPQILRICSVSTFASPSTWVVETDRGTTELVLKGEEDIRRLRERSRLLITSAHGVVFEIPDSAALDRASRKLLERFL
jgi:hypothetical protein